MNKIKSISTGALVTLGSLFAQSEESRNDVQKLDETVVTGLLWESEIQDTTASVSVLDNADFKASGAQHLEDIINGIPNLSWTGGTSRPRYIQVRGIGENSQFEGETPDSSVRFLVDDLDFTGIGTIGGLFDAEQVEVLRGPQAGSFGVNAAGGVVKIVTAEPTAYWTGKVEGTVGDDSLRAGGFAIGGPLVEDQLSFRTYLYQLKQDGFKKNRTLAKEDTNKKDELTSQLKLKWTPSSEFTINGSLFYADSKNGYDEFVLNNNNQDTYSDRAGRDDQESTGASIRATYSGIDAAKFTSISQFNNSDSLYSYDSDWGAGTTATGPSASGYSGYMQLERDRNVFSQELRLDSKENSDLKLINRWTAGIYYHNLEEDSKFDYTDEFGNGSGSSKYETESIAIFGQLGKDFSESTRLTLGLRYEHHEVDNRSNITNDYFGSLIGGIVTSGKDNHLFGGKLTLEHDFNEAHKGFASIARGYKAAGANNGGFIARGDPLTYNDETIWNYELGLRSQFAEGKVSTQITAFYLDRKDAQLRDSAGSGGFFRYFTSNQGNAEHFGIESEVKWFATKELSFTGGLGLLETELDRTKRDLANAPSYTYTLRSDLILDNGFFTNLELVGSDSYFESNSHAEKRNAFGVLNGALGYMYKNWTVTLWSRNILDERYEDRVFFFDNFDPFNPGTQRYEGAAAPRQIGATLNYSW